MSFDLRVLINTKDDAKRVPLNTHHWKETGRDRCNLLISYGWKHGLTALPYHRCCG